MVLRRIETGFSDAHINLALEEAIFKLNHGISVRVWGNERSVIIGRAQLAKFETDLDYCKSKAIPVVRRFTAGGAVYNGPGNLNWSMFVKREKNNGGELLGDGYGKIRFVGNPSDVFRMAASVITEALRSQGIETRFEEPNRIVSDEGKVSGMAAYLSRERLLCHGTLLLNADLEEAALLTSPRKVQLDRKYVRSKETKIANLGIKESSFNIGLWDTLSEHHDRRPEENESTSNNHGINEEELQLADKLTKYRDADWNLGDPFNVTSY